MMRSSTDFAPVIQVYAICCPSVGRPSLGNDAHYVLVGVDHTLVRAVATDDAEVDGIRTFDPAIRDLLPVR